MTRPTAPILVVAAFVLLVAACGGGSGSSSGAGSPTPTGGSRTPATAAASSGNGSVDCAKIKAAGVQLLAVQLLAQMRDPDSAEAVKTKQIGNFDPDQFLAAMQDLHALDGTSSVFGSPKEAIDTYVTAAKAAKTLFATEPITQAAVGTYLQDVGTITEFLGHQAAISAAMDAAGC